MWRLKLLRQNSRGSDTEVLKIINKVAKTGLIPGRKIMSSMDSEKQSDKAVLLWIQKLTEPYAE